MRIYRVKVNDYPGIYLDYLVQGEVSARTEKYAANTVDNFLEDIMASVVTLAADRLFDMRKTAVRLEETEGRAFHRATASLLLM